MTACPFSLLLAASLPVLAAAGVAAAASTAEIEAYVLVGSGLAVLLSVAYLRTKLATAGFWAIAFTVVATFSVGWLLPEPLVWYFTSETSHLPRKLWAFIALICGLGGSTAVITILKVIEKYLPAAVEKTVVTNLPGGMTASITVPVKPDKNTKPPSQT